MWLIYLQQQAPVQLWLLCLALFVWRRERIWSLLLSASVKGHSVTSHCLLSFWFIWNILKAVLASRSPHYRSSQRGYVLYIQKADHPHHIKCTICTDVRDLWCSNTTHQELQFFLLVSIVCTSMRQTDKSSRIITTFYSGLTFSMSWMMCFHLIPPSVTSTWPWQLNSQAHKITRAF